jgi:2'-5' RNA ligase
MAIAVICAAFDPSGDSEIAAVRELVRALGGRAAKTPAHRPHLTLSAAQVEDPNKIARIARRVAKRHKPFRLRLTSVGTFGRGDVVWLGPWRSAALNALQSDAYAALVDAGYPPAFAGQSDPRGWRSHCTIARRLTPPVLTELTERFEPINLSVIGVATIVVGGHGDVGYVEL